MAASSQEDLFAAFDDNFLPYLTQIPVNTENDGMEGQSPSYSPHKSASSPDMRTDQQEDLTQSPEEQLLNKLDSEKSLSAWNLLHDSDDDVLVKEYFETLKIVKVRPCVPDISTLTSLPVPGYELPTSIQVTVLNHFTAFFQCRYSALNINDAVNHDVCLFSPFIHFKIPQFELLPKMYYTDSKAAKSAFVQAIQTNAVNGLAFTIELILLRILKEIWNHIITAVENETDQKDNLQYFYLSFFKAAQANFQEKFKVKSIDWTKRESRVKDGLPKWRKQNANPPIIKHNRYVRELTKKVTEGKVKITALGVIQQTSTVSATPTTDQSHQPVINVQSVQNPRTTPAQSSTKQGTTLNVGQGHPRNVNFDKNIQRGVKEITMSKQNGPQKRNMMDTFNKNRNLSSDEATTSSTTNIQDTNQKSSSQLD